MKCLNRNVLIGIAVFAIAMFFVAPGSRGLLPLLFVAVCPLAMILMMLGMSRMKSSKEMDLKNAEIARLEAMLQANSRSDHS